MLSIEDVAGWRDVAGGGFVSVRKGDLASGSANFTVLLQKYAKETAFA